MKRSTVSFYLVVFVVSKIKSLDVLNLPHDDTPNWPLTASAKNRVAN
jgi:hypothetical protein